jgi:DNA-binding beta-propeller fold protein YncE
MRQLLTCVIVALLLVISCKVDDTVIDLNGSAYPYDVGKILLTKCTNPGCHNTTSKEGAAGLSLTSWKELFEGGRSGAAIIPTRPDFSTLCFYTNTYPDLGVTLKPIMPYDKAPLSREEYTLLSNWVKNGAPDRKGNLRFAGNSRRKKIYVSNLRCDVVTVFDSETLLAMNYVDVGTRSVTEYPVMLKVAPDGNYWYVVFTANQVIQKYNAEDDSYVGTIDLGSGQWNSFEISPDSQSAFCVDNNNPGKIAYVDLVSMQVITTFSYGNNFIYPRGVTMNKAGTLLYAGPQFGNFVYKINVSNPLVQVTEEKVIDGTQTVNSNSSLDIHQVLFSGDETKYYVSCERSQDIRVIQSSNDSLLASIPVGTIPQFMALYKAGNLLFVSCPYDTLSFPGNKGCVVVIDCQSNMLVKKINTGIQPYGIAIDESKQIACVANGNSGVGSHSAHHVTKCGGQNGNVTFIDLNTLDLIPGKKAEVAVYPYSVAIRK